MCAEREKRRDYSRPTGRVNWGPPPRRPALIGVREPDTIPLDPSLPEARPAVSNDGNSLFSEITRIERKADEILEGARHEAEQIGHAAREQVEERGRATDREVDAAEAKLAEEYEAKTKQALTQVEVAFLGEEEQLETVRERRFDELVEWALDKIRKRQLGVEAHGD